MSAESEIRLYNNIDNHAIQLVNNVTRLFNVTDVNNVFSDVRVTVGNRTFYCHKLILQLNSQHLASLSFQSDAITLQGINPDLFYDVLQFMYTGEVLLSKEKLESLLSAADILGVKQLRQTCIRFLQTLERGHAMNSWKLAEKYKENQLAEKFQLEVLRDFKQLATVSNLRNASEEMMIQILRSDKLCAKSETEVCEMLLMWLKVHTEAGEKPHTYKLLSSIRWSGVTLDYFFTNFLQNDNLSFDPESVAFLSHVATYLESGVQFEGLQTFHRPSTGLENCLISFSLRTSDKIIREIHIISLQRPNTVTKLADLPDSMNGESKACVHQDTVYIVGTGRAPYHELWKWNVLTGLERCPNMPIGRRYFSTAVINSKLFVLGGVSEDQRNKHISRKHISSIDCYNIENKIWSVEGDLTHPVNCPACTVYKNSIYLFGGYDEEEGDYVNWVQVYNVTDKSYRLVEEPMPERCASLRVVRWDRLALLFGRDTCFIFNFETETWQRRDEYKTKVSTFGIAIDNATVYIAGGCVNNYYAMNLWDWKNPTDEIKYVSIHDVIEDKLSTWKPLGKLHLASGITTYGMISLPLPLT